MDIMPISHNVHREREKRYPAIIRIWENAWAEFVPLLRFDQEIRTVICTTNAIEILLPPGSAGR
jgi:transposase-like protein